jgi:hypothetical protein
MTISIMTLSLVTPSILTHSILSLSITTLVKLTNVIMTISIMGLIATPLKWHSTNCFAERQIFIYILIVAFYDMLSVSTVSIV